MAAEEEEDGDKSNNKKKKKKKKQQQQEQLPRFKHVKPFALAMFNFSPLLQHMIPQFESMYNEFSIYKRSISTYGTILLNRDATKIALCRVYKGKKWMLPAGKVNQNESGKVAAARETYEECGFDPNCELGLTRLWAEKMDRGEVIDELLQEDDDDEQCDDNKLSWAPLQDSDKLVYTESDTNKRRTCYVCRGVPENFPFEPVARKEVSEVAWHDLSALPKQTFAVLPFFGQLRKWIKRDNRKRGIVARSNSRPKQQQQPPQSTPTQILARDDDLGLTPFFSDGAAPWEEKDSMIVKDDNEDVDKNEKKNNNKQRDGSRGKKGRPSSRSSRSSSRAQSRGSSTGREVSESNPLVESALASPGDTDRWTEDQMFTANEHILGRKITYDGNPHDFAEKGFNVEDKGRVDPHSFRIVGGAFLNSEEGVLSAAPEVSKLQPLVNASQRDDGLVSSATDDGFTPFFSDGGKAPWEELGGSNLGQVQQQEEETTAPPPIQGSGQRNSKGLSSLSKLRQSGTNEDEQLVKIEQKVEKSIPVSDNKKNNEKKITVNKSSSIPKKGVGAYIQFLINEKSRVQVERKAAKVWHLVGGRIAKKKTEGTSWLWASDYDNLKDAADYDVFMTDKEVTAKSQREKLISVLPPMVDSSDEQQAPLLTTSEHLTWMKQWMQRLPKAQPTKEFGDFRLDVHSIMSAMKS